MTMMIMMMMRLADQYWLGGQSDRVGGDGCRSELHDAAAADDEGSSIYYVIIFGGLGRPLPPYVICNHLGLPPPM